MDLRAISKAYFLGIGGIGMSAIARYLKQQGVEIHGYDKVRSPICIELEHEGMMIHYEDDYSKIPIEFIHAPDTHICIWTPALPKDFGEILFFKSHNITLYKRAEVLGMISRNTFTIAIAGTHGKTTTTTLVTKALSIFNINFTAFLGGISTDFGSNYISIKNKKEWMQKPIMVVEADEFDHSFLHLHPNIAIVTSTDADHLDIYGAKEGFRKGFEEFVQCIEPQGVLIQKYGLDLPFASHIQSKTYGNHPEADYQYSNPHYEENHFSFGWHSKTMQLQVTSGVGGEHNAENATAVLGVIDTLKLDIPTAAKAIADFHGVKRRFEKLFETPTHIVIDDYAHHPTELQAIINAVKKTYPKHQVTGIFQPHLYTRTRDFLDGFVSSLNMLDECWLMDIYPAREKPIEGITSNAIAAKLTNCRGVFSATEIYQKIKNNPPSLLLIMGAGDIDRITQPVKEIYEELFASA